MPDPDSALVRVNLQPLGRPRAHEQDEDCCWHNLTSAPMPAGTWSSMLLVCCFCGASGIHFVGHWTGDPNDGHGELVRHAELSPIVLPGNGAST